MSEPDPIGSIYLTAKARMSAESRLNNLDFVSQILVSWYSLWIIAISIIDLSENYEIKDLSFLTLILSIGVMCTSIFLPAQKYGLRASRYRDCYLDLQNIMRSSDDNEVKISEYNRILRIYDNHDPCDYEQIIFNSWLSKSEIWNSRGPIEITGWIIARVIVRFISRWFIIALFFSTPIFLSYFLVQAQVA